MAPRVLFVFTSADKNLVGHPSGWFLPEAAHPYYVLHEKVDIDFAAPLGPNPPVDPFSVKSFSDADGDKFLADPVVKQKFATAKKVSEVDPNDYDVIFYVGGQGPILDLAYNPDSDKLANAFFRSGKLTTAVCHGTGALSGVTDAEGQSIFKGRTVTGFSNAEEEAIDGVSGVPFLLEDRIKELGGTYVKAEKDWAPHVVVDGKIITGQNPASAKGVGEEILKALFP
ncbi:class I glutamine amidotransferase-like protein [Ceratobasidium sp. AG-I]|nr:class I glutamine amidotransferase-like protein [Ceratobasidium sp. AG-I]